MKITTSPAFVTLVALTLSACSQTSKDIRVTNKKAAAVAQVQATSRSEPIFYNGKTYQFDLFPRGEGLFALKVSPMRATQEKDAVAVATSSLGYYACADGKAGQLLGKPAFSGKTWTLQARCS